VHDRAAGEAVLDQALAILRADGPEGISVRAVADAAGTSTRAVYAVFGSKQALIDALAERGYRRLTGLVEAVAETDDPAADLVTAGVEGFRAFALEEPALFRLTFEQVSADLLAQESVARAARDSYASLLVWVRRLRATGGVHPDRSDAWCCFAFHAACQGLASCELASWSPPEGPGMWAQVVDTRHIAPLWVDTLTGVVRRFADTLSPADVRRSDGQDSRGHSLT
jgi:AcrR family transcriptional regulator